MLVHAILNLKITSLRAILIVAILLSASCFGGGNQAPTYIPPSPEQVKAKQERKQLNSQILFSSVSSGSNSKDYIIGPTDLLEVDVYESEKLSDEVRVSSRGFITLPLVGNIQVDGLTARDLEEKYESLLKKEGYIRNPHVSISIVEYRSKVVDVMGFVNEPGEHELIGRQTILDALADAKGLTDDAGNTIYLSRTNTNGSKESYIIDIDQLLKESGDPQLNMIVHPGDIIFVPEAGNVYVEGAVKSAGSYSIENGSATVSHMISKAGGIASFADQDEVKLIRYHSDGQRQITDLDLKSIRDGAIDDPVVQDGDAIIVGTDGTKKFFESFRLNLGYGLVGVGYDPPTN